MAQPQFLVLILMMLGLLEIGLRILTKFHCKLKVGTLMQPRIKGRLCRMTADKTKKLVIDASVAHASGNEGAVFPTSKKCRDLLITVLENQYEMVMTTEIGEEWRRHQSNFARRWRVSMEARKKVFRMDAAPIIALREKLLLHSVGQKQKEAIKKDLILIEAALQSDNTIISLDDTVRGILTKVSKNVGQIKGIVWVNPDKDEEKPLHWIKNGAQFQVQRTIGYQSI